MHMHCMLSSGRAGISCQPDLYYGAAIATTSIRSEQRVVRQLSEVIEAESRNPEGAE
jgi:hypothetical protein